MYSVPLEYMTNSISLKDQDQPSTTAYKLYPDMIHTKWALILILRNFREISLTIFFKKVESIKEDNVRKQTRKDIKRSIIRQLYNI